ncbi:uncharacterized protein LOC119738342 [Patiria miniata]|nr:uncharacterized protein LOC119738342 [Patiria miniata]
MLLQQLKSRLEEHETDQEQEISEKLGTIEDLHARLRANVSTIQQLNEQLHSLKQETVRQRSDIEKERAARQNLQMQLESREQALNSLKAQMESERYHRSVNGTTPRRGGESYTNGSAPDSAYASSLGRGSQRQNKDKMQSAINSALKDAGVSDPNTLDKSYWIQRVGELSLQLQQSSEFWSDKVRDLSAQLGRSRSPSPHK